MAQLKNFAMLKKGQKESTFIDPANPDAGEILWTGLMAHTGPSMGILANMFKLH